MKQLSSNNATQPEFLTVNQLAKRWQFTTVSIRRFLADGLLPVIRIGDNVRIAVKDIEAFEESNKVVASKTLIEESSHE